MEKARYRKLIKKNYKSNLHYVRLRKFLDKKKRTKHKHEHPTFFHHICEELKAAIFVASLITIITYQFKLLDSDKLDSLQLMLSGFLGTKITSQDNKNSQVAVVLINDFDYETKFDQASPLDRRVLQKMLDGIRQSILNVKQNSTSKIKIFFDLDLSPSPSEWPVQSNESNNGQSDQERQILSDFKALSDEIKQLGIDSDLYLIVPQAVLTNNLRDQKAEWMDDMCDHNINFIFPYIPSSYDFVLQYFDTDNSPASLFNGTSNICELYDNEFTNLLRLYDKTSFDGSKTKVINFKSAATIPYLDAAAFLPNKKNSDDKAYKNPFSEDGYKAINTIFVGGSYGQSDIFDTPIGPLSGVYLHAASYLSEHSDNVISERYSKIIGYIIEIILGTIIGVLFFYLAQYYRNKQNLMSIGLNICLQPLIAIITVWISAILLIHGRILINPAPLILSMALHADFVRLDEPKDEQTKKSFLTKWVLKSVYYIALCWAFFILAVDFFQIN